MKIQNHPSNLILNPNILDPNTKHLLYELEDVQNLNQQTLSLATLMALTHEQMQQFLFGLEKIAASYGMQLNKTKTEVLSPLDHTASLYFSTGAKVSQ